MTALLDAKHVHRPVIAALTCECGQQCVWLPQTDELEAADFNWQAIIRRLFTSAKSEYR